MQILNAKAEGDKNPGNDPAFMGSKAIFLKSTFQKPLFTQWFIVIADAFIEWSIQSRGEFGIFSRVSQPLQI